MVDYLNKANEFLWAAVELLFVSVLGVMLIYLILGQGSGVFVLAVADNVLKFGNAVPTPSLIGMAIVLMIVYAVMRRLR